MDSLKSWVPCWVWGALVPGVVTVSSLPQAASAKVKVRPTHIFFLSSISRSPFCIASFGNRKDYIRKMKSLWQAVRQAAQLAGRGLCGCVHVTGIANGGIVRLTPLYSVD